MKSHSVTIEGKLTEIRVAEDRKQLDTRNALALAFFKNKSRRVVRIASPWSDGRYATRFVETWWDSISRNWITQTLDKEINQIGNCDYTGNQHDAAVAHFWAIQQARKDVAIDLDRIGMFHAEVFAVTPREWEAIQLRANDSANFTEVR